MENITNGPKETQELGKKISADLKPGDVLALYGELGSGKTTFIQGIAQGLGIEKRVISPTFVFVRRYPINRQSLIALYHIDLYRIGKVADANGLGLEEIFNEEKAITVIEWAGRIKEILPKKRIDIHFEYLDENQRKIKIKNQ